jgi:phosphomannomutase
VATTIVSSSLLGKLAEEHGVQYVETLTGFKWLARAHLARPELQFVYAYEEALGSCVGGIVKDKDGISAAMAFAELVAATPRSVLARLDDIYRRHGVHRTVQHSIRYEGLDALAKAAAVVDRLVAEPPKELADRPITAVDDLRPGFGGLPPSDVVRLHLDGARVIVRPSGTEPKLKSYIEVVARSRAEADAELSQLSRAIGAVLTT